MINLKKYISLCPSVTQVQGILPEGLLGFCHDTRAYKGSSFFIAYPGAKYNPVEHVGFVLEQGCPAVIYEKNEANNKLVEDLRKKFSTACFIQVESAITFTQELSGLHTKDWQSKGGYLFAISGSNGKTTHKEMLSFILNSVYPGDIESTQKNNNNHLGVPFTLLQIKPNTKVCVLELGSNHPGEIEVLCNISRPQGGLVTNIGATHLEFFDNLENVFKEEGYLYTHLIKENPPGMMFFQNIDDEYLKRFNASKNVYTYSTKNKSAHYYFEITPPSAKIFYENNSVKIENNFITGTHNYSNLATAYIIAINLFPNKRDEITKACNEFKPTFNRSQWQKILNCEVFLDAYNANPSSMRIALDGFFEELTRKKIDQSKTLLVLGDMNELGPNSEKYHYEIGQYLKKWPNSQFVFVGRFASHYLQGCGHGSTFSKVSEIDGGKWRELTHDATHVFIKGSRSLQLESLLAIT